MSDQKTVVITGGNGFVGRHLVKELKTIWGDYQIIVWDKKVDDLPEDVSGVEIDITKPETYLSSLQENQPDWLIHLAAIAQVPASFANPDLTFQVNVEATKELLQSIKKHSRQTKTLAVSSADIYGKESATPIPELPLTESAPRNPYAESKVAMEKIIEEEFNSTVLRVRPFPHIGPGQGLGFVTSDFASQIAAVEQGRQDPVIKVGNLTPKRDFTDVRDVVRAYRLLMEKGDLGEVYHVASGKALSIEEILNKLINLSDTELKIETNPQKNRPSDISVLLGSTEKLNQATGWEPRINIEKSLEDILNYWRENI